MMPSIYLSDPKRTSKAAKPEYKMKELQSICTESIMWKEHLMTDSSFEVIKIRDSFKYEGKLYTYHMSGLCRSVYKSECGQYVIKIPTGRYTSKEELEMFLESEENFKRYGSVSVHHNYYEAKAYQACPEAFKHLLAKTELLPNCWIKQEYVEVHRCSYSPDLREIGKRVDGSFCIFDFDPLLDDFKFDGFHWEKLPKMIRESSGNLLGKKN